MTRLTKFLEHEVDRINEYLSMVKTSLVVPTELCEDYCKKIVPEISERERFFIECLNLELEKLNTKIDDAKEIVSNFKKFCFEQETLSVDESESTKELIEP